MTRERPYRPPGTLQPGQWDEMMVEINRALYRFMPGRNGDPKAGMAYTLLTLANEADATRDRVTKTLKTMEPYSTLMGEDIAAKHTIHSVYYTLVETYVIKPGHPEQEKQ